MRKLKKMMRIVPAIVVIAACAAAFAACGHTHEWSEWTATKAATCTEAGVETRSCSCGEKESRPVAASGHTYGEEITDAATVMKDGQKYRVCSVCGEKETTGTLPRLTTDSWDGTVPTAKPETYVTDESGNVALYGAAAFAWFAHTSETDTFYGKTVMLYTDIDLGGHEFAPFFGRATASADGAENAFEGTFDGQEYTISNLSIEQNEKKNVGLFAAAGEGALIKNLTVKDADVAVTGTAETAATAAAVGALYGGTIENVTVDGGSVSGYKGVGGIVGRIYASGSVIECANSARIDGFSIGGIAGQAYYSRTGKTMKIENCVNSGIVTGTYAAGGITSLTCGSVLNCENTGSVAAPTIAAGIVAEMNMGGVIDTCENSAAITGGNAGGIAGWIRYTNTLTAYQTVSVGRVTDCVNSGAIGCEGQSILGIGGIVGMVYNAALVEGNTNNAPKIEGTSSFAGGIIGGIQHTAANNAFEAAGWDAEYNENDVRIIGNTTTTTLDNISVAAGGTCKDLLAYVNDPQYVTKENNSVPQ